MPWYVAYVMDTHTHHRIYSVTVVMPRPYVKIKQRDLKGESHMFELKEGAEKREPFEFERGVCEPPLIVLLPDRLLVCFQTPSVP